MFQNTQSTVIMLTEYVQLSWGSGSRASSSTCSEMSCRACKKIFTCIIITDKDYSLILKIPFFVITLNIEIGDYCYSHFPGHLFLFLHNWKYDSTEAITSASSPGQLSSERVQFGFYFSLKTSTYLSEVNSKSLIEFHYVRSGSKLENSAGTHQ